MTVPTDLEIWASDNGSAIVGSLVATAAQWQSNITIGGATYGIIRFSFSGSPNLSSVLQGHALTITGMANDSNNGENMEVYAANNTNDTIDVLMPERTSNSDDETGATGSGSVTSSGARRKKPSSAKLGLGFKMPEKISDGHLNWLFNRCTEWIDYFANGGAITFRATLAAWKAVTRTGAGGEIINEGGGFVRFDETATDESGEGFYAQTTGAGVGVVELASPDMIWALLANEINETLTPVSAYLDFGSISATSTGTSTVTVYGARSEDAVSVGLPSALSASVIPWARVTADDTVTIYLYNPTGSPIDPAAGDFNVFVTKPNRNPANTLRGLKIKTNLLSGAYASGTALDTDLALDFNTAAFWLLLANTQHKEDLLNDAGAYAILQASTDADAIMAAMNGGSY